MTTRSILIILSSLAYVVLFLFTMAFWLDIELYLLGPGAIYASILFLPHGVRVISTWLLGPRAFLGLYPAHLLCAWIYDSFSFSTKLLILALPGALCAPIAFELFRLCGLNLYPGNFKFDALFWRKILIVTIVASMINSMGTTSFYVVYDQVGIVPELLTRFLIGDVMGTILLLVVFVCLRKHATQ